MIEGFQVQLAGRIVAHLYARGDHTWLEWQRGYRNDPEDLGLRLGRSRRFEEVSPESFALLARRVGAPVGETMDAVARVARNLEEAWAQTSQLPAPLPQHRAWLDTRIPEVARRFSG